MTVVVNGSPRELRAPTSVADLVAELVAELRPDRVGCGSPRGVAVALNGEVVPRGAWAGTQLDEGDRVEVLTAVQGG